MDRRLWTVGRLSAGPAKIASGKMATRDFVAVDESTCNIKESLVTDNFDVMLTVRSNPL